jgi:hypothetical protein
MVSRIAGHPRAASVEDQAGMGPPRRAIFYGNQSTLERVFFYIKNNTHTWFIPISFGDIFVDFPKRKCERDPRNVSK